MSWDNFKGSMILTRMLKDQSSKLSVAKKTWSVCAAEYKEEPLKYQRLIISLKIQAHKLTKIIEEAENVISQINDMESRNE